MAGHCSDRANSAGGADAGRPLENGDWAADTPLGGERHYRFTPAKGFGVRDHAVFEPGEALLWTPMGVLPN